MTEKRSQQLLQGAAIGSVGLEMGVAVAAGYLIGMFLDKWLGTHPWMTVVWIGFGLAAAAKAVWNAYLSAKKIGEEDDAG